MGTPAQRDLTIYRGDDYVHEITFTDNADPPAPLDLTGYTFKAQIRDRAEAGTAIRGEFEIDTSQAAIGIIVLSLSAEASRIADGYWDLQVTGTSVMTWLKGIVQMSGDVTHA